MLVHHRLHIRSAIVIATGLHAHHHYMSLFILLLLGHHSPDELSQHASNLRGRLEAAARAVENIHGVDSGIQKV